VDTRVIQSPRKNDAQHQDFNRTGFKPQRGVKQADFQFPPILEKGDT
jgi:hypothetical protein